MRDHRRSGLSWERLSRRATLLATIRAYFAEQGVLEVDTPLLRATCASDPLIPATATVGDAGPAFLQSSPEALMKCLLAEHRRPIYQLGKVYRHGEIGRLHQPEFTMLEWYRPGWSMRSLMDEVATIVRLASSGADGFATLDWRAAFREGVGIDPLSDRATLARRAAALNVSRDLLDGEDPSGLRDLLFSHCVQPGLGRDGPVFLTGFAAADASFARLDPADETRALRFELYWSGVELANGGEELTDPAQWRQRADRDRARRCALGLPAVPPDEDWAAALDTGLPAASGVALGVDRLLMLAEGCRSITEVAPFARS